MSEIKWCGIDFGQSLMEPTGLRTYLVIGDTYKALGRPEGIPKAMKRFRQLAEAYGGPSPLKEQNREKIYEYALEGDTDAVDMFIRKEREHLSVASGAEDAFTYLKTKGIEINIVAELKTTLGKMGTDIISQFLKKTGLGQYFSHMYTPQGKITLPENSLDDRYKGKTKESGQLYEVLVKELDERGINPHEMLMVGDKITTDIIPARRLGIKTAQYTGYTDMGPSEADYRITSFVEIIDIVEGERS